MAPAALATNVILTGVFGHKAAIIAVNGGEPRTIWLGQRIGNVTLVSVDKERATVEVNGNRRLLIRGQTYSTAAW